MIALLGLATWENRQLERVAHGARRPRSEAMEVSVRIFRRMAAEARSRGQRFLLVVMPTEYGVRSYPRDAGYRQWWDGLARPACAEERECVDLLPTLAAAPPDSLDLGYTDDHHGPRANRLIASALARRFFRE